MSRLIPAHTECYGFHGTTLWVWTVCHQSRRPTSCRGRSQTYCACPSAHRRTGGSRARARRTSSSAATCATTSSTSSTGRWSSVMARPRSTVGELGAVQVTRLAGGAFRARGRVRDDGGTVHQLRGVGQTEDQARAELRHKALTLATGRLSDLARATQLPKRARRGCGMSRRALRPVAWPTPPTTPTSRRSASSSRRAVGRSRWAASPSAAAIGSSRACSWMDRCRRRGGRAPYSA